GIRDRNVTGVQTCALPISVTAASNSGHDASESREAAESANWSKVETTAQPPVGLCSVHPCRVGLTLIPPQTSVTNRAMLRRRIGPETNGVDQSVACPPQAPHMLSLSPMCAVRLPAPVNFRFAGSRTDSDLLARAPLFDVVRNGVEVRPLHSVVGADVLDQSFEHQ